MTSSNWFFRFFSTIVLVFGMLMPLRQAYAQEELSASDPETRLPFTLFRTVNPPVFTDASVSVFADPSDKRNRYYIYPYFLANIKNFSNRVDELCKNREGDTRVVVEFTFEISSKDVNEQVMNELAKQSKLEVNASQLHTYPFAVLTISTGAENADDEIPTVIRHRFPPGVADSIASGTIANTITFQNELGRKPIYIRDSCDQLAAIAARRDISAHIYSQFKIVKRNATLMDLQQFAKSKYVNDLFKEESSDGEQRMSLQSSGGAVGLNLGGILGGASDTSDSSAVLKDTRSRAISGNLIQNAASRYAESLSVTRWIELGKNGVEKDSLTNQLFSFITRQSEKILAEFYKAEDGRWSIVVGQITRTIATEDIKRLQKSSVSPDLSLTGKESVDCAMTGAAQASKAGSAAASSGGNGDKAKGCSAERGLTYKDPRNMQWEYDGKEWIPTSVELYIVSRATLDSEVVASAEEAIAEQGSGFMKVALQNIGNVGPRTYTRSEVDAELTKKISEEMYGPPKQVEKIEGGIYRTVSHYGSGDKTPFECLPKVSKKEGMTQIGGNDTKVWDGRKLAGIGKAFGCRKEGHCDSTGEYCISYERDGGCLVDSNWLAWYRKRIKALRQRPDVTSICAP